MNLLIVFIVGFIALIYIYTYIKYKKRKKNQISIVDSFRENYIERINAVKNDNIYSDEIKNQITKYNSSVDYIEWKDFVDEISEQTKASESKTNKPKRLRY